MQVQLNIVFDPADLRHPSFTHRLEQIITAAGLVTVTVVPASDVQQSEPSLSSDTDRKARMQQQAANARAAKQTKQVQVKSAPQQAPVDDVAGPNGAGDQAEDDTEDMGLVPPSMSPGEARDAALAIVREAYSSGHVAEVKALQKEWQVAKFYDVPVDQGHAFYARVMKLAQGVGIRQ